MALLQRWKLFNCANYLIKTGSAKPNIYDLYNKLSSNFFKLNLHSQTTTKVLYHVVRGWLNFFDYMKNKSLTTFRLKTISELKSRLDSILNKAKKMAQERLIILPSPYFFVHGLEEKIFRLWYKIAKVNEDFAHKVAKYILALALKYNVKEIVIGDGFRNKNKPSGMKDIANQLWHLAPHGKAVEYLKYLCKEHKMKLKVRDERYSSSVDSTGCAVSTTKTKTKTRKGMIKKIKEYTPERRISRGLYKSSCGILNADINAARNIGGIRGEEGLREVERIYLYQKKRRNKRKSNEGTGKGKESKGSLVERVEAVAVAGGSKVCMSKNSK
jgi:IS605 OrfB family transposase